MSVDKIPLPEALRAQVSREIADLDIHDQNCDYMAERGGGVYPPCDCDRVKLFEVGEAMERIAKAAAQQEHARLAAIFNTTETDVWRAHEVRDFLLSQNMAHPPPTPEDRVSELEAEVARLQHSIKVFTRQAPPTPEDRLSTDKLPEAVREQIERELGLMTLVSTWAEQNDGAITAAFLRVAEAAAQQERARLAQFVTMEPPYCRCPDGACILHPTLSTCGMRSGQIVNFSVDAAAHPPPTPEDR